MARHRLSIALALTLAALLTAAYRPVTDSSRWWKGNLHTHSLWTDGEDFPEMIAAWYRSHGYNFLAITEHDMLQQGERWADINAPDPGWPPRNQSTRSALPEFRTRFPQQVEEKTEGEKHLVRLHGLEEYRSLFEKPDVFMFLMAEEVTDRGGAHMNAFNISTAIKPRGGENTAARTRNNLAAVEEQRAVEKQPIAAIVNHPNYVWTLTAEEIASSNARLFEVYNGHWLTNSSGDNIHASSDRAWDIILSLRNAAGKPLIFGVASDDAHAYRTNSDTTAMPGRGWVMVPAPHLQPDAIVNALNNGDFYASTGVTLRDVARKGNKLRVKIANESGVTYHIQFVGTLKSTALDSEPVKPDTLHATRRYSSKVGEVLKEVIGREGEYTITGQERYVRVRILSSKPQIDPLTGHKIGFQMAWTQPVTP